MWHNVCAYERACARVCAVMVPVFTGLYGSRCHVCMARVCHGSSIWETGSYLTRGKGD